MEKNRIIGLSIGILIVLIIVVSSTYAYWQITKTQTTPNDIVAACLNLDLSDASAAIDLDSAWPISDEEGKNLAGYTFTVTNNCDEEINYIVGLNRVEEESANYLLDSSIKLQLDDNSTFLYSDLADVEYSDAENTEYTARVSKQVSVETISGNGTNTHTIRVWINDEAPVTEQSKTFLGQVFITGGQGIEVPGIDDCFSITNNGMLIGYDESCGLEVKIPAKINGVEVREIHRATFDYGDIIMGEMINENNENVMVIIRTSEDPDVSLSLLKYSFCEEPEICTIEDIKNMGFSVYDNLEDFVNEDWTGYSATMVASFLDDENLDNVYYATLTNITLLDLSETIYLEKIGRLALGVSSGLNVLPNDNCVLNDNSEYDCKASLQTLILPENGVLNVIGDEAFYRTQISNVNLPEGLISIGEDAFCDTLLTKVVIPSTTTTIGSFAFYNDSLTEAIIKNTEGNITIADGAFGNATITYNPNYTEYII